MSRSHSQANCAAARPSPIAPSSFSLPRLRSTGCQVGLVPAPVEADEAHESVAADRARARGLRSSQVACMVTGFDEVLEAIVNPTYPADTLVLLLGFRCAGLGSRAAGCWDVLPPVLHFSSARAWSREAAGLTSTHPTCPLLPTRARRAACGEGRVFHIPTLRRQWLEGPLRPLCAMDPSASRLAQLQRVVLTLTGGSTDKGFGLYRRGFGSVVRLVADRALAPLDGVPLFREVRGAARLR